MISRLIGGRYTLTELLGAGGMGEVYRAVDRLDDAEVALKIVKRKAKAQPRPTRVQPSGGSEEDETKTIEMAPSPTPASADEAEMSHVVDVALASEFRVLSTLRHPNIVGVLDYGFDSGKIPYFTMSLLSAATTVVQAAQGKSLGGQLDLLFQLLEALSYLHRHGVMHRDLKPSNVLVTGDKVTVLDFGLAGLRKGMRMGTYGYMAPEVQATGVPTAASDLYAVGVIAFEILTGRKPFGKGWRPGDRLDLSALSDHGKLGAVVEQLLLPEPSQRPADANATIAALANAAGVSIPPERVEHRESYLKAAAFTGRRRELAQLKAALQEAIEGSGSGWLLGGESGVGKSRLLAELRAEALVQGVTVLSGQAGSGVPYSLFRTPVLRMALIADVPEQDGSVLKAAFPDIERVLGRRFPDDSINPQTFTDRLTSAVLGLVRRCPTAIVLELEDCHLIGESLHLFKALVQQAGRLPLLMIGSYRDNERPRLPQEVPGINVMRLARFNEAGIRDLVTAMLGPELGGRDTLVQFLARETEGNAFFLVEAIRTLAEESGRLDRISPDILPSQLFAPGILASVSHRLDSLPAWAERPLRVAAVLGREVDVPAVAAACPNCDVTRFLLECDEAGVLEGYGYQWRFTHDKMREALMSRIEAEGDRSIFGEAAAAVESLYGDSPAWINVQARCWKQAGVTEKAVRYLLMASSQCLQAGATSRAVDLGLEAVAQLGVEFPADAASQGQAIGPEMQRISELMAGRTPAELMRLPLLQDSRVEQIIGILVKLAPGAHINQRFELFALAVVKCMALTLEYGLGPDASFVFGTYGLVIRNLLGEAHLAYEFSRLAVEMQDRLHGRGRASTGFVHHYFLHHWIHPIETSLGPILENVEAGFEEQDTLYGCFSAAAHVICLSASGAALDRVVEVADAHLVRVGGRVQVAAFHTLHERQMAQALAGHTTGPLIFSDTTYDEERDLAYIVATSNHTQSANYYRSKMQIHYLYRDYAGAMAWAEKALPLLPSMESQFGEWQFVFFHALTAAARARQVEGETRTRLLDAAISGREKFRKWASDCEANFAHRRHLIGAEIQRLTAEGDPTVEFQAAIAAAEARGWLHDVALAHELLSSYYRDEGNHAAALRHVTLAAEYYERWGAHAKAKDVRTYTRLGVDPAQRF